MKLLERFDSIDPRYIYLAMAIALIFPVLKPIGLPISIDQQLTQPVFDWIEGLNPGDIVIFDAAYGGGSDSELGPQLKAWFTHCMKRGVKVVGIGQWEPGSTLAYTALTNLVPALEAKGISARYGEDWVMIGYRGGGMPVIRAYQDDFWKTAGNVDWVDNDLSTLPLMSRVKKWDRETIKGFICFSAGSPGLPTYTQYFPDHDLYVGDVAVQVAGTSNLLRSGQVKGIIPGLSGAAQYEKLLDEPGLGVKLMDAQSLGHVIIIGLVIIGNIGYRLRMRNMQKRA
ncbi:MAG: hypothetical protein ACOX5M_08040 [Bacillota bacterium]|jgi:hypothetical protein